jgi:hypothetical protein
MPGAWPPKSDTTPAPGYHQAPAAHGLPVVQRPLASRAPQHAGVSRPPSDLPMWDRLERRPVYPTLGAPVVDLTSSPALRGGYGDRISYTGPPEFGFRPHELPARAAAPREMPHRNVYRPGATDDDVIFAGAQTRPQGRRHPSYNYGGTRDRIEVVKPEDYPIPSREEPYPGYPTLDPYHGDTKRMQVNARPPPGTALHAQHQPVFGQPAYPQMRSQTVTMQVVPRPVHGAPAAVQPMPPPERAPSVGQATSFGAPSPQRFFMGSNHQPYYVPDR